MRTTHAGKFREGVRVQWNSQANGSRTHKEGVIVAVIADGVNPFRGRTFPIDWRIMFDSLGRRGESYLVLVDGGKGKKSLLYQPRVSALELVGALNPANLAPTLPGIPADADAGEAELNAEELAAMTQDRDKVQETLNGWIRFYNEESASWQKTTCEHYPQIADLKSELAAAEERIRRLLVLAEPARLVLLTKELVSYDVDDGEVLFSMYGTITAGDVRAAGLAMGSEEGKEGE